MKIETSARGGSIVNRYYINKSIEEEYLKRTNGVLEWKPQFIYEVIVDKHLVKLTLENYLDFPPRKMMAYASLYSGGPDFDIIDEYGNWFHLDYKMTKDKVQKVFSNYNEF